MKILKFKKVLMLCIICLLVFLVSGCENKTATQKIGNTYMSYKEFIEIASTGTPQEVESAVKNFKDINKIIMVNSKPIPIKTHIMHIVASKTKYPEVIDILAKNGANLNVDAGGVTTFQDKEIDMGMYPINLAAINNPNIGIVTALYNNGAKATHDDYKSVFIDVLSNPNPSILEEVLNIEEIRTSVLNSRLNSSTIKYLKHLQQKNPSKSEKLCPKISEKLQILYKYSFSD